MSLNLKNPVTHELVRDLARLTGETMTEAVTEAVRERLARVRTSEKGQLADRLLALGKDCASHLSHATLALDHGELLYDENGLPR